jgi:hypothetical protein
MQSAVWPVSARRRNALLNWSFKIRNPLVIPSDWRFFSISLTAVGDDSTKTTCSAPRLSASIPTAPVPANKSNQWLPVVASGLPAHNMLKRVSRRRSEVGRMSSPRKDAKGRLRYLPAITRIFGAHYKPKVSAHTAARRHFASVLSAHFGVHNPQRVLGETRLTHYRMIGRIRVG